MNNSSTEEHLQEFGRSADRKTPSAGHEYFDFEVSLSDVEPPIWRRFLLRSTASFEDLHLAIQQASGWWNYHLFSFCDTPDQSEGGEIAGSPDDEREEGDPVPEAANVKLSSWFGQGKHDLCYYLYDFGDSWWHEVLLRGRQKLPELFERRLLGGARAFPREDSGGISGYEDCVKVMSGNAKEVDDPEGLRVCLGGWHPELFDLKETQKSFDR